MKFSKSSQLFLVSSIGLLVATLLTACQLDTIDYVYVASSSGVQVFAVDSQSGALRTGAPTVTSGVSSPVAMAVTSDYANLYVANKGNNTVVHFAIGLHGDSDGQGHNYHQQLTRCPGGERRWNLSVCGFQRQYGDAD